MVYNTKCKKNRHGNRHKHQTVFKCHGCKKPYKRKTALYKHKAICKSMKTLICKAMFDELPKNPLPPKECSRTPKNDDRITFLLWNVEGLTNTFDLTSHDTNFPDVLLLTETFATDDIVRDERLWFNSRATKAMLGRPSGGIAIGLHLRRKWNAKRCHVNKNILCIQTDIVNIVLCYFQPAFDVLDIIRDISNGLSSLSLASNLPTLVAGDFNCRLDSGCRGSDLCDALSNINLVCLNDPEDKTFVSKQGSSTIDLAFVSKNCDFVLKVIASL